MPAINPLSCCILNSGAGSWAFEPLALQLSKNLGIEISAQPRQFNYILHVEDTSTLDSIPSFIPVPAILLAADKRLLAEVFNEHRVPSPRTVLLPDFPAVQQFLQAHPDSQWCLKFPTSCGANGHRLISATHPAPPNWPAPFVVQEFIALAQPEVYRTYCAGGELFGWIARRFPVGNQSSPWVAHARGARYVTLNQAPSAAQSVARAALQATDLWNAFGCVDLLCRPTGEWVALEVGTDGVVNHVDRDLGDASLETELNQRITRAFWQAANALNLK